MSKADRALRTVRWAPVLFAFDLQEGEAANCTNELHQ
jgi:hypothetical protein